jgi:hypothetical protein
MSNVKEVVQGLQDKYHTTLKLLVDALDKIELLEKQLDKKPKEVIIEKEVVIEKRADDIKKALVSLQKKYDKTLKALDKKPKEVIIEKEIEVIKEVIKEVPVEKVVEKIVEKPVEIEKKVVVTKEVPGPERIVEVPGPQRIVEVPGPERIVERTIYKDLGPERIVQVPGPERIVVRTDNSKIEELEKKLAVKPSVVEKANANNLIEAARIMSESEFNKEGYTEEEILNMLTKSSEEDVDRQLGELGFWAIPLPKDEDNKPDPDNLLYTTK